MAYVNLVLCTNLSALVYQIDLNSLDNTVNAYTLIFNISNVAKLTLNRTFIYTCVYH